LTLLYLRNGDAQAFASTLNELDKNYLSGKNGYEFMRAAHLLKDQVEAGKGLASSCDAFTSMIEKNYPFCICILIGRLRRGLSIIRTRRFVRILGM
jgi:hypothetical protein